MSEYYPSSPSPEYEGTRLDELLGHQLNDITGIIGVDFVSDEVGDSAARINPMVEKHKADTLTLYAWTKHHADKIPEKLSEIGYPAETLDDRVMKRLNLYLRAPHFVHAQRIIDTYSSTGITGDLNSETRIELAQARRELVEFGAKIRDVVKAEPDISQMYLVRQLGNVLLWSGLPPELQDGATRMLERYTNGAMAELVMEQLVTSQAAKEAGITHEDADIWDDLRGIDMYVKVPVRSSSGRVVTPAFSLDIKSSRQQYLDKIPPLARNIKHYYIDRHRVLIWPGVTWEDMHDRMTLTDEDIEKRAPWAIEQLEMAARDILIDEFFIKREMATAALKQWLPEHQVEEA